MKPPTPAVDLRQIGVMDIICGPHAPRQYRDDERLERLVQSITNHGLIEPIVLRPNPTRNSPNGKTWELIAGARRWRAAYRAGLDVVPAIIRQVDDTEALLLAIAENEDREDLNALELAASYRRLTDSGLTQQKIAAKLHVSQANVSNFLRLLELPESVRELLQEGRLAATHGVALCGLSDRPEDCALMATAAIQKQWSTRQLEFAVGQVRSGALARVACDGVGESMQSVAVNTSAAPPAGSVPTPRSTAPNNPAGRATQSMPLPGHGPSALDMAEARTASAAAGGAPVELRGAGLRCMVSRADLAKMRAMPERVFILRAGGHCAPGQVVEDHQVFELSPME